MSSQYKLPQRRGDAGNSSAPPRLCGYKNKKKSRPLVDPFELI